MFAPLFRAERRVVLCTCYETRHMLPLSWCDSDGVLYIVAALHEYREIIDELDQESVPFFVEILGSRVHQLILYRHTLNIDVPRAYDYFANVEVPQTSVVSPRDTYCI